MVCIASMVYVDRVIFCIILVIFCIILVPNLCEVGGHKQGLPVSCIKADSIAEGALTKDEYGTHAVQAYMSIWHNTGDSHPGGTSLKKQDVVVKSLESSSVACDPQLVMTTDAVTTHGLQALSPESLSDPRGEAIVRVTRDPVS